jgi:hypothetical protein
VRLKPHPFKAPQKHNKRKTEQTEKNSKTKQTENKSKTKQTQVQSKPKFKVNPSSKQMHLRQNQRCQT